MDAMHGRFGHPGPRQVEPGEYPAWEEALALVNRDVLATLPDQEPLRLMALPPWEEGEREIVHVTLASGEWWGDHLRHDPAEPDRDPLAALAAVAEAAQDTVTERLWQAWPVCAAHDRGMHLSKDEGHPVWRCAGDGRDPGHVGARVGELGTQSTTAGSPSSLDRSTPLG